MAYLDPDDDLSYDYADRRSSPDVRDVEDGFRSRGRWIRDGSRNFFGDSAGEDGSVEGLDVLEEDYQGEAMGRSGFETDERLLEAPRKAYTKETIGFIRKDPLWNRPEAGKSSEYGRRSFLRNSPAESDARKGMNQFGFGKDFLNGPPEVIMKRMRKIYEHGSSSKKSSADPGKVIEKSGIGISEPFLNVSEVTWKAEMSSYGVTYNPQNESVTEQASEGYGTTIPNSLGDGFTEKTRKVSSSINPLGGPAEVFTSMVTKTSNNKINFANFSSENSRKKTIENPSYETSYTLINAPIDRRSEGLHKSLRYKKTASLKPLPTGRENSSQNFRLRLQNFMEYLRNRGSFREENLPNFYESRKLKNHSKRKYPSIIEKDLLKQGDVKGRIKDINTDLKRTLTTGSWPLMQQKSSSQNLSEFRSVENALINPFKGHAFELSTLKQETILNIEPNSLHKPKREFGKKRCKENVYWYIYIIAGLGSLNAILLAVLGVFLFKIFRQPRKAQYAKLAPDFSIETDNLNPESPKETCTAYTNPNNYLKQSPSAVQKTIIDTTKQPSPKKLKYKLPKNETNSSLLNAYQRIRCIDSFESIPEVNETHDPAANSNFSRLSYKMEITRETNKSTCGGKEPGTKHKNISYELEKISYNPSKVLAKEIPASKKEFEENHLTKRLSDDKVKKNEKVVKNNKKQTNHHEKADNSKSHQKNKIKSKIPGKAKNHHEYSVVTEINSPSEIHQMKFLKDESSNINFHDRLEKTIINVKHKDERLKNAKNIHSKKEYPKMLNPFDTDNSAETISECDSEVSNDSMEYSEAGDFLDVSDQNDEQAPTELSPSFQTNKNVERTAVSKIWEQDFDDYETAEIDRKITTQEIYSDVPASKRLLKLHRKITSKGFCGPTGSLK